MKTSTATLAFTPIYGTAYLAPTKPQEVRRNLKVVEFDYL